VININFLLYRNLKNIFIYCYLKNLIFWRCLRNKKLNILFIILQLYAFFKCVFNVNAFEILSNMDMKRKNIELYFVSLATSEKI